MSATVATTTPSSSGSRAANSQGASRECASPASASASRGQPKPATPTALTRTSAITERGPSRTARTCRSAPVTATAPRNAERTCGTVSHGCGARIFATCGAKAGDAVTTSAVGPSATISPSASTTTRSREVGGQLHVVRGQHDGVPVGGQRAQHVDEAAFAA